MYLEIVSPEATLFRGEVDSVAVPGVEGAFHMLNNHAPIISLLEEGYVKIHTHSHTEQHFHELDGTITRDPADDKIFILPITSGVVEMKNNHVVILAD